MTSREMNYTVLIDVISHVHQQTQAGAAGAVNRFLVLRNWLIEAYIIEYEQKGKDRAEYGESLLSRLSVDLQTREVAGCSRQMLQRMRLFYQMYPQISEHICSPAVSISLLPKNIAMFSKWSPVVSKFDAKKPNSPKPLAVRFVMDFSWTHLVELIAIDDPWKRAFYENECLKGNWSKRRRNGSSTFCIALHDCASQTGRDSAFD